MTPDELLRLLAAALPAEYRVTRFLKNGGQGAVFAGEYSGTAAAIKIFTPNPDRFAREVVLLQAIQCPTLVKLLATTSVQIQGINYPVVAYEFLGGGDLTLHLQPGAAILAEALILKMGSDIGKAVDALWDKRIVHRDIKPDNIMEDAGRFVLVDVGIARHLDMRTITVAGGAPGTFGYKSPEQAAGRRNLTKRSDIFSLGVTLYELAAKQHPFNRDQTLIGRTVPVPLIARRPDMTPATTGLIDAMLSFDPIVRPLDASDQLARLAGG